MTSFISSPFPKEIQCRATASEAREGFAPGVSFSPASASLASSPAGSSFTAMLRKLIVILVFMRPQAYPHPRSLAHYRTRGRGRHICHVGAICTCRTCLCKTAARESAPIVCSAYPLRRASLRHGVRRYALLSSARGSDGHAMSLGGDFRPKPEFG